MENVVVAVFPVESEAYQAFSRIKDGTTELSGYLVSQMAIVKKMGNNVQLGYSVRRRHRYFNWQLHRFRRY